MRIILPVFLLLCFANVFIFIKRNEGYDYVKQSAYQQLYPNISKGIYRLSVEKEKEVVIDLKGFAVARWNVFSNDTMISRSQALPLRFSLQEGIKRYSFVANDSSIKPLIIDLDYSPVTLYQKSGNSTAANYEIRYCNYPFLSADTNEVMKWRKNYLKASAEEIKNIQTIISDSLRLTNDDSSIRKIRIIGNYLFQSINQNIGTPPDSLANHSAYEQFCFAKNGQVKIWCGNIADIFDLFASQAGIVCRQVGLTGTRENFTTGLHTANECYIPETGEWAYIDITQNILLLQDTSGRLLNTVYLFQLKKMQQADKLTILTSADSSIITTIYQNADKKYIWEENEILFPYPHDASTLYNWKNKLKRYFSASPWLEIYSEKTIYDNQKFYWKIFMFYSWVTFGFISFTFFTA